MAKYRKKPVVIEAVQWVGTTQSLEAIAQFAGQKFKSVTGDKLEIQTLEGPLTASLNDWIIKGVKSDCLHPCKPDIFEATYESVEDFIAGSPYE